MIFGGPSIMQLIPQDELLMEKIRQDDPRALHLLFDLYYSSVCAVIYYYTNNKELSEELGADVFIKIWDKRKSITIARDVKFYLLAMAKNEAFAKLKKKSPSFIDIDTAENDHPLISSGEDPEHALILDQSSLLISAAVSSIKDNTRIIFCLSRDEGLKYREIADLLNISEKTVEHHIGKALKHLRAELDDLIV